MLGTHGTQKGWGATLYGTLWHANGMQLARRAQLWIPNLVPIWDLSWDPNWGKILDPNVGPIIETQIGPQICAPNIRGPNLGIKFGPRIWA